MILPDVLSLEMLQDWVFTSLVDLLQCQAMWVYFGFAYGFPGGYQDRVYKYILCPK